MGKMKVKIGKSLVKLIEETDLYYAFKRFQDMGLISEKVKWKSVKNLI